MKRLINKRNVSRETTVKEINAQRIQNAIVLGWNFCAQLPISSIANDLSLPGPDLIQVKCIQQSEQLLHVKILMWPGEFMSTFIYALMITKLYGSLQSQEFLLSLSVGIKLDKRNLLLVGGRLYDKVYDIFSPSLSEGRLCLIEFNQGERFVYDARGSMGISIFILF